MFVEFPNGISLKSITSIRRNTIILSTFLDIENYNTIPKQVKEKQNC